MSEKKPLSEKIETWSTGKGAKKSIRTEIVNRLFKEAVSRAEKRLIAELRYGGALTMIKVKKIWKDEFGRFE